MRSYTVLLGKAMLRSTFRKLIGIIFVNEFSCSPVYTQCVHVHSLHQQSNHLLSYLLRQINHRFLEICSSLKELLGMGKSQSKIMRKFHQ